MKCEKKKYYCEIKMCKLWLSLRAEERDPCQKYSKGQNCFLAKNPKPKQKLQLPILCPTSNERQPEVQVMHSMHPFLVAHFITLIPNCVFKDIGS